MKAFLASQIAGWRAGEVAWLVFCLAAVTGLSLYWGDGAAGILAATTGMLYTILAGKGKISCFAFGLVNTPLYAGLSFRQGYYGDAALNVFYFVMMFPALAAWARHRAASAEEGVVRARLSASSAVLLGVMTALATAALWWGLRLAGGTRPLCDALTNVLSVAAMILTVHRAIEQWVLWSLVDAIEVFLWWRAADETGRDVSLLVMWLLFLANGFWLLVLWLRTARRHPLVPLSLFRKNGVPL
jgi:nicotinamide mononucleotide transporter